MVPSLLPLRASLLSNASRCSARTCVVGGTLPSFYYYPGICLRIQRRFPLRFFAVEAYHITPHTFIFYLVNLPWPILGIIRRRGGYEVWAVLCRHRCGGAAGGCSGFGRASTLDRSCVTMAIRAGEKLHKNGMCCPVLCFIDVTSVCNTKLAL